MSEPQFGRLCPMDDQGSRSVARRGHRVPLLRQVGNLVELARTSTPHRGTGTLSWNRGPTFEVLEIWCGRSHHRSARPLANRGGYRVRLQGPALARDHRDHPIRRYRRDQVCPTQRHPPLALLRRPSHGPGVDLARRSLCGVGSVAMLLALDLGRDPARDVLLVPGLSSALSSAYGSWPCLLADRRSDRSSDQPAAR